MSPANGFVAPYPELGKYWVMIPKDTYLLITHSPPHRFADMVENKVSFDEKFLQQYRIFASLIIFRVRVLIRVRVRS